MLFVHKCKFISMFQDKQYKRNGKCYSIISMQLMQFLTQCSVNFDRASYCILGNLCADVMQIHEQAQMFRDAPAASLCILEYVYCILADAKTNWHSILQKGMHSSLVSYM